MTTPSGYVLPDGAAVTPTRTEPAPAPADGAAEAAELRGLLRDPGLPAASAPATTAEQIGTAVADALPGEPNRQNRPLPFVAIGGNAMAVIGPSNMDRMIERVVVTWPGSATPPSGDYLLAVMQSGPPGLNLGNLFAGGGGLGLDAAILEPVGAAFLWPLVFDSPAGYYLPAGQALYVIASPAVSAGAVQWREVPA